MIGVAAGAGFQTVLTGGRQAMLITVPLGIIVSGCVTVLGWLMMIQWRIGFGGRSDTVTSYQSYRQRVGALVDAS